jgi:hypothetical protein
MDKDGYNDLRAEYERGFIDGMQEQARRSVDRAVNAMVKSWVGLTDDEIDYYIVHRCGTATKKNLVELIRLCEIKLKEKNT